MYDSRNNTFNTQENDPHNPDISMDNDDNVIKMEVNHSA